MIPAHTQIGFRQHCLKWSIYFIGLLVMALGIVLIIKANLGASPWDVFHIGLQIQLGLTIGTWSIIVGFIILAISGLLMKRIPQLGAFLNMIFVGIFIDLLMLIPFLVTPSSYFEKMIMFVLGIIINGYGMGLYISSKVGAGPRDSLMIALTEKTGWKVQYIRFSMEVIVMILGYFLGGPVFIGTIIYSFGISYVAGYALPHCQRLSDYLQSRIRKTETVSIEVKHFSN